MDIILHNIGSQISINFLVAILCVLFGYLFGSIQTSIVIGKLIFHQDPRNFGSGNAGGTNAGRLWGKKWGLFIIILDMIKTIAPLWITWAILTFVPFGEKPLMVNALNAYDSSVASTYLIQWPVYWLTTIGCIVGHCWPIWYKFKGGKGASCFMGLILGSTWMIGGLCGLTYFATLKAKKYVSLTIIVVSILGSVAAWVWAILVLTNAIPNNLKALPSYGFTFQCDWVYALTVTSLCLITIFQHRSNIKRLKDGNERKIKWMK